jgi:hypothetical protein
VVGDLEEILGDLVENLNQVAMDLTLSPDQAEQKACQLADNALRVVEEQRRLEAESGDLLGLDQALLEDLGAMRADARFVSAEDLRQMVDRFVATPEMGGRVTQDEVRPGIHRLRLRKEARDALLPQLSALGSRNRVGAHFERWLRGNDPFYEVTFDQQAALEQRDLPFVTPIHPLAKLAAGSLRQEEDALVSCLMVRDQTLPAGQYLFVCDLWESVGIKPEIRIVPLAWNLAGNRHAPEVSQGLLRCLGRADDKTDPGLRCDSLSLQQMIGRLDELAHIMQSVEVKDLRERNEFLASRQLASLETYQRNRLRRLDLDIQGATNERILRMKRSERERAQRDYERKRAGIESHRDADIITRRIAAGVLEVRSAD